MDFSYDFLSVIYYIGIIGCILFLAIAVLLFFLFKIPSVLAVLNGSAAKKAIDKIEKDTMNSEVTQVQKNVRNRRFSRQIQQTDEINKSTAQVYKNSAGFGSKLTDDLEQNKFNYSVKEETDVLNKTAVLNETQLLETQAFVGETAVLNEDYAGQTTVLYDNDALKTNNVQTDGNLFEILSVIMLTSSEEIIL